MALPVTILGLETSCDETACAVVREGRVLAHAVGAQLAVHAEYGGVVPELATREHLRHWLPLARQVLQAAAVDLAEVTAVAATQGPGLPQALLIGLRAGQAVAFALERPFFGIHHHEAHLYSPWITGEPPRADFEAFEPHVALIASGGHTLLVHVEAEGRHRLLVDAVFSPSLDRYTAGGTDPDRNGIFPAARSERFTKRHNDQGGNLVFVDGHAAFFRRTYITNGTGAALEKFNPDVIWNPHREPL